VRDWLLKLIGEKPDLTLMAVCRRDEGARRQSRPFDALPVFPGREYHLQKTKVAFGPPQDQ